MHVLLWPRDRELRERLARSCAPRLVVAPEHELPASPERTDEVWASTSSTYPELVAAADRLMARIKEFERSRAWVDEDGVVHRGRASASLSRSEAIVMRELLRFDGHVVARSHLRQVLESAGQPSDRALEAIVYRLRLRVAGLRILVRSVRTQGFAAEVLGRVDIAS